MKIIIDDDVVKKEETSLPEILVTIFVQCEVDYNTVIQDMAKKGKLLKQLDNTYFIPKSWRDKVEKVLTESSKSSNTDRLTALAEKMRAIMPQGKVPGTPYYYKGNLKEIVEKLKKFISIYGDFTDEEFVNATQKYINSFNGDFKYLKLLKYFIYQGDKTVTYGNGIAKKVEENSLLATYLENKDNQEVETPDWLNNLA